MKLDLMERAESSAGILPDSQARRAGVFGFALGVHFLIFWILSYSPPNPFAAPSPPIAVKLVIAENKVETESEPEETLQGSEPTPNRIEPEPEPESTRPAVNIILNPAPISPSPSPNAQSIPETGDPIPDRWRLPDGANIPLDKTEQPINPHLKALTQALDCLGFDADCAAQRKVIFAEEQLSGTDLVWMPSFAHSGLSNSDLFGLSEAQIRDRLGIPTAGKNGVMLLPGIGISGPWWDTLHGVNKACDYGLGFNDSGQKQLMKRCETLKPSSKDRIGFIPKPVE